MILQVVLADTDLNRIESLAAQKRLSSSAMGRLLIIERLNQIDEHTKALQENLNIRI